MGDGAEASTQRRPAPVPVVVGKVTECAQSGPARTIEHEAANHAYDAGRATRPLDAVPHPFCQTRTQSTSILVVLVAREP
jgi:hypothetical protein